MSDQEKNKNSAALLSPYIDWAMQVSSDRMTTAGENLYHPVFIREKHEFFERSDLLKVDSDQARAHDGLRQKLASRISQLLVEEGDSTSDPVIVLDLHEAVAIHVEWSAQASKAPEQFRPTAMYVYMASSKVERLLKTGIKSFSKHFEILDIGLAVPMSGEVHAIDLEHGFADNSGPIMAIIDDGIGFLNKSFTEHQEKSRFASFWMQAIEKPSKSISSVHLGRVFENEDLGAFLRQVAAGEREDDIYRLLMEDIVGTEAHQSLSYASSHGTMVADLAFGKRGDPVDTLKLLGVQLPPETVEDTSGVRFAPYLVMAARWILARAHLIDGGKEPLIITVSMGFLAGPKNGSHFVEYALAETVERWRKATGRRTHIIFPYGNRYESQQVATLCHGEPLGALPNLLEWVLQPDDPTTSYLEIRSRPVHRGVASRTFDSELLSTTLMVLKMPNGEIVYEGAPPEQGTHADLKYDECVIGRLYHVPPRAFEKGVTQPAMLVCAMAPTADRIEGGVMAPSGAYKLDIIDVSGSREFVLQIQRGDTAPGYIKGGRQSYFDNFNSHQWDQRNRDFSGLSDDGAITHKGTNSALSTAHLLPGGLGDSIFSVGAAMLGEKHEYLPAGYSSEGADWSGEQPKRSHLIERQDVHAGKLACGTLSGSMSRLSGTSAAAPLEARNLALTEINGEQPDVSNIPEDDVSRLGDVVIDTRYPLEPGEDRF